MLGEIRDEHTVADCIRMLGYELRSHDENPLHATRKRCLRIAQSMRDKFQHLIFSISNQDFLLCIEPLQRLRTEIDARLVASVMNGDTNWQMVYTQQLAEIDSCIRDIQAKGVELTQVVGIAPAAYANPLEQPLSASPVTA